VKVQVSAKGGITSRAKKLDRLHRFVMDDAAEREIADEIGGAGGLALGRDVIAHLSPRSGNRTPVALQRAIAACMLRRNIIVLIGPAARTISRR
jgi:hypothetical protein